MELDGDPHSGTCHKPLPGVLEEGSSPEVGLLGEAAGCCWALCSSLQRPGKLHASQEPDTGGLHELERPPGL